MAKNKKWIWIIAIIILIIFLQPKKEMKKGAETIYQETADVIDVTPSEFIVEYTKPVNSFGGDWEVKHGNLPQYKIILPNICWNAFSDRVRLKMVSSNTGHTSENFCYTSVGWEQIGQSITTVSANFETTGAQPEKLYDGKWAGVYSAAVWDSDNGIWRGFQQQGNWKGGTIVEEAMWWNIETPTYDYQYFLSEKDNYIGGGDFNNFISNANNWVNV